MVSRGANEQYGAELERDILRQLAVDRVTFDEVLRSRLPPGRPAANAPSATEPGLPRNVVETLCEIWPLDEVRGLEHDEAIQVAITLWSLPAGSSVEEKREQGNAALRRYRDEGEIAEG